MLVISHPLDSGSSRSVFCLPFYATFGWSLFTVPANACSPSTFALEAQLDWHFAAAERMVHHKSDDRLAVQRQLKSCSLASRVVHSEPTDSRGGANIAEAQKGGVQCYLL